jgi:hypothetical protein
MNKSTKRTFANLKMLLAEIGGGFEELVDKLVIDIDVCGNDTFLHTNFILKDIGVAIADEETIEAAIRAMDWFEMDVGVWNDMDADFYCEYVIKSPENSDFKFEVNRKYKYTISAQGN